MDLKEIIKWLFQVRRPEFATRSIFDSRSVACWSLVFLAMVSCNVSLCMADSNLSTQKPQIFVVTSEPALATESTRDPQIGGDHSDSKKSGGKFNEEVGLVKMFERGSRYLDGLLAQNAGTSVARTFGRPIRKLQAALLPIMFKLGVLATLIVLTFILAVKAVGIGLLLLMFKVSALLAKLYSLKGEEHHGWSPNKEVHLHVHNSHHGPPMHDSYYSPVGHEAWSRQDPNNDSQYRISYPSTGSLGGLGGLGGLGSTGGLGPVAHINTPYGHYVRTGGPTAVGY